MQRFILISFLLFSFSMKACLQSNTTQREVAVVAKPLYFVDEKGEKIKYISKTVASWKAQLDSMAFYVLRQKGTERAFSGKYNDHKEEGTYTCAGCGLTLFSSDTKFDSGTGWPSFYRPIDKMHVIEETDKTLGMSRVEVLCRRCNGHLGHVFDDGPEPTGLRYCMNSVSLNFVPK